MIFFLELTGWLVPQCYHWFEQLPLNYHTLCLILQTITTAASVILEYGTELVEKLIVNVLHVPDKTHKVETFAHCRTF